DRDHGAREHRVDRQHTVVGLRLALVRVLRELDRAPGPGQDRIGLEVPSHLAPRLDAEAPRGGVEEAEAVLLADRVDRSPLFLPRLPSRRELADLARGEILERDALRRPGGARAGDEERDQQWEQRDQRPRRHQEWTSWSTTCTSWPTVRHSFTMSHEGA